MCTADHNLFLGLNFDGGPAWDTFFWHVSGKWEWIPLFVLLLWFLWRRTGWRGMLLGAGFMALAVVVGDQIANFFKSEHTGWLAGVTPRLRPSHTPELEGLVHTVRGYAGGLYGTVSAHASTAFAIATFSALALGRWPGYVLLGLWALLVCYSRIYLGVHFPLDLLYGTLLGIGMGAAAWAGWRRTTKTMRR